MKPVTTLFAVALLAACTDPGASHRANVYDAGALNQRQEVKTVNILSIVPAKVEVDNTRNQEIATGVGAVLGAVAGALLAPGSKNDTGGAVIGGVVGAGAGGLGSGDTKLIDGVQIIYQEDDRSLSSVQVGRPCDFAPGAALVFVTRNDETRIQSNHDCVQGQEMVMGAKSKLGTISELRASDQDGLAQLERERQRLAAQRRIEEERANIELERGRVNRGY